MLLSPDEQFKIPDRFTLVPVGSGEFRLHSLGFSLALSSPSNGLLGRLLPLLDGTRTVGEILLDLESDDSQAVCDSIEHLLKAGALERAIVEQQDLLPGDEARRFRSQVAFFSNFVAPPGASKDASRADVPRTGQEYQRRLKRSHVAVFGVGRLGSQLIRSLAVSGIGRITAVDAETVGEEDLNCESWFEQGQEGLNRAEAASALCLRANSGVEFHAQKSCEGVAGMSELLAGCDVAVLCPDHFNPAEYQEFNLAALASKTTWISARLSGFELVIGPTVIPGETPCFQCLESRIKSNVPDHSEYVVLQEYLKTGRLRAEALAITPGADLLALEVLKIITWFMPPATYAHLYSLSLLTLQSRLHPVLKIPRCTACGRSAMPRPTIHAWQQTTLDPIA